MNLKRILQNTIETWEAECKNIMSSQVKYNESAKAIAIAHLQTWIKDLDNEQT